MPMERIYDLHTHTTASDGSLTPTELVEYAHNCDINVLAVTDHDITQGIDEARERASELDIELVSGIELSVTWSHQTLHILGLQIDNNDIKLNAGLKKVHDFRESRGKEIARRLEKAGIEGALEGAKKYAKGNILSRTHFAHFLVEKGFAKDTRQVFKRYLVHNKPGYVSGDWVSLEQAIEWIHEAGGLAVIAHPARYRISATRMRQLLGVFRDLNGEGIEVVSGSHSANEIKHYSRLAEHFGFWSSRGSDYHGPEHSYSNPKFLPVLPDNCQPIWQHPDWQ